MFRWLFGRGRQSDAAGQHNAGRRKEDDPADLLATFVAEILSQGASVIGLAAPILGGTAERVQVVGFVAGFVDAATQEYPSLDPDDRLRTLERSFERLFGSRDAEIALKFYAQLERTDDRLLQRHMQFGGEAFLSIDEGGDAMTRWSKVLALVAMQRMGQQP
jgi:hypothetical protein